MTTATAVPYFAACMLSADIVASTSPAGKATIASDEMISRSFIGKPSILYFEGKEEKIDLQTSGHQANEIFIGPERIDDDLVAQIHEFQNLDSGWDGESAARPNMTATLEASNFVRAAWLAASIFEPTIHADGSIILEVADNGGSLRFKGDGKIIYFVENLGRGVATFNGRDVPAELLQILEFYQ